MSDEPCTFDTECMHFDKDILIKLIYTEFIVNVWDVNCIFCILQEFSSESSMVHYIQQFVPCHCFDEFALHYTIDNDSSGHELSWNFKHEWVICCISEN